MMTVVWWGAVSVVLYGGSVSLYLSPFMFQCTMGDAVSFVLYGGVL